MTAAPVFLALSTMDYFLPNQRHIDLQKKRAALRAGLVGDEQEEMT